jgi:Flp pilus assembly protein TadG
VPEDATKADRGSAVVEFALVMPVLLVVTLGMLQVGLMVRDQLIVTQAARAGAREASVAESVQEIRAAVVSSAVGIDPARVAVTTAAAAARGSSRSVRVTYDMPISVPFVGWLFPPAVTLSADASMRQEFDAT